MNDTRRQADLLDQFLDTICRQPSAVAPPELGEETARFVRAVVLVERGTAPRPALGDRVWQRVQAAARTEPALAPPRADRLRLVPVFRPAHLIGLVAAVLVVVIVGLWMSPQVRAHMERLLCFVPGLGIRACEPTGLVATEPVSVSRDGVTLTVKTLLSTGAETTAQVEITGLPSAPSVSPQQVRLVLRDERGRTYPPAPRAWGMSAGGAAAVGGSPQTFRAEAVFVGLNPDVRVAEVEVTGPDPIGLWRARVPLTPVQEARLPAAQETQATVSLHGITVRVAGVVADQERTVVQLVATAEPPFRFVRGLGGNRFQRQLALRDEQGREYPEVRTPSRSLPDQGGVHTDDIQFSPLAADARSAELVVPFVVVAEQTGEATLTVPVGGKQVGDSIPLGVALTLGQYSLLATDAAIVEQRGQLMLALRLDLGARVDGRRLFGLERVLVNGRDVGYQFIAPDAASNLMEVRVALPEQPGDDVTIAFRDAQVAVDGPWLLPVAVPAGR